MTCTCPALLLHRRSNVSEFVLTSASAWNRATAGALSVLELLSEDIVTRREVADGEERDLGVVMKVKGGVESDDDSDDEDEFNGTHVFRISMALAVGMQLVVARFKGPV